MNAEQEALVKRLQEAGLDTRRFLKLNKEKRAFEEEWQNRLYTPEELERQGCVLWGINGKDSLVLVDADRVEMADVLRQILPATFEVLSPRRGLPHFYYVVKGEPIPNKTLHLHGEEEGAGEVRAQNYYLVAPGTEIRYKDLRTSEEKTGQYRIIQDRPFAVLSSADFMKTIKPYLGKDKTQKITLEHMRKGVPQGTRHAMGIRYADYLIGVQQLDYATALFEMKKWNQLCQPPMDEKDLERMVKNAIGYVATNSPQKKGEVWFDREDLTVKPYEGDHPLCIRELLKGVDQELRNEGAIRYSSYLVNFCGMESQKALWHVKQWNKLNSPSFSNEELLEVFKSSLKGYIFGCDDPFLRNYCVEGVYCPLRKKEDKQPAKEEFFDEATLSKARALLEDPGFFYLLGKVFEKGFIVPKINKPRFIIDEDRNKRILGPLLIGASKLGMTSIIKVLGEPGTAKDTMLRMWLVLLPIKSVERSYMTAASLRYSPDMQNSDLLYIPDTPELQGEVGRQLRFMRSDDGGLVSEYAIRDAETGEMTTKVVTLPIKGLATTSNAITGDAALESGMWTLTTDPRPELTAKVKKAKLKLRAGERPLTADIDLHLWKGVFKVLIEEEQQEIPIVPYANQLFDLLESERSESRRDPDKLCDLIGLVAWMRRFQKPSEKRMEADLIDLYFALQLGLDAITQTISELSPREQQIFDAVKGTVAVSCRDVASDTKIPYKTCYNYLEKLVDKGYLNQDKDKNRNIYSVLATAKTPKTSLFAIGRSEESPEQLLKVVLDTVRNSSTEQPQTEDTHTFIDPLKGYLITIRTEANQDEITIDKTEYKGYVYPSDLAAQRRSSEPSKERGLDSENKPSLLLLNKNRNENSLKKQVEREPSKEPSTSENSVTSEGSLEGGPSLTIQELLEKVALQLTEVFPEEKLLKQIIGLGFSQEEAQKRIDHFKQKEIISKDDVGNWYFVR
jgi:predicted transcriptional regulator